MSRSENRAALAQRIDAAGMDRASYFGYWGKARPMTDSAATCHLLPFHCLDVAAVGMTALEAWPSLRALLSRRLELDADTLSRWVAFCLALHDLGKFAESFQSQCTDVFDRLRARLPNPAKRYVVRHDSLGMLLWKDVLRDELIDKQWLGARSFDLTDGADWWMRAVTGHHGQPPVESDFWKQHFDPIEDRRSALDFVGAVRTQFLDADVINAIAAQDPRHFCRVSLELSWWVAGLAVLADWLGSNTHYFPYDDQPKPIDTYWPQALERARRALEGSGVLAPGGHDELPFARLFPNITVASPLQGWAATVALDAAPQIHLLEDVTGAGKTEAAVMLAHRLMAAGCAEGFFIGLPTMATANAMYARIAKVYAQLFAGNSSLVLAHGQRDMVHAFAASILPPAEPERDARQLDETAGARCSAWLADHNKRALLAPAGVGTLDQALLAVLHSKHQSLRLLGLLRKVLVVDEVHACDAYMQGVLEVLLEFHARAGGSAILLSATLPQRMKQALLAAFARGAGRAGVLPQEHAYPLVTSWTAAHAQAAAQPIATRRAVQRNVRVRTTSQVAEVVASIRDALDTGRCVCWIRNTVADALDAYSRFESLIHPDKRTLFHARFALGDRLDIEQRVLDCFGHDSGAPERAGRLLIATQVVEQSLDVDFDLVVTDLAPIDRVIQRAGRLCRHARDASGTRLADPAAADQRGEPWLWVLAPPWSDSPDSRWYKAAFPKAATVYPNHAQCWLTAKSLRAGAFTMPDDARTLIEGVFSSDAAVPPGLDANALVAEGQGFAAASQAQANAVKLDHGYQRGGIDWWSEAKTPSRIGEATSTVMLARWQGDDLVPWIDGEHGWAYSSLRVAERWIAETALPNQPRRRHALEEVKARLPGAGRWCVLLPLERTADGWVGVATAAGQRGEAGRQVQWRYDPRNGLQRIGAASAMTNDDEDADR